jgi:hypothetical protein
MLVAMSLWRGHFAAAVTLLLIASPAVCQQLAFTTRSVFSGPVAIASFTQSKVYGFESAMLSNDGDQTVRAVHLVVSLRDSRGEEVVEVRRIPAQIAARERKQVIADLGHVAGLAQKAGVPEHGPAIAILAIKSVEFEDGTVWESGTPVEGVPEIGLPVMKRK